MSFVHLFKYFVVCIYVCICPIYSFKKKSIVMLYFHETSIFYWDLLSKLNFIQAGLHPSRITVAVPHPTNAHEYSRWVLGDLEPSSRFAVPSLLPKLLICFESQFVLFTLKTQEQKNKTKQKNKGAIIASQLNCDVAYICHIHLWYITCYGLTWTMKSKICHILT